MSHQPLILPSRQLDGTYGFFNPAVHDSYLTSAKTWTGTPVKTSDYTTLPIAWTPQQLYILRGTATSEAQWRVKYGQVNPPSWYATQHTLIRKPKIILVESTNLNSTVSRNAGPTVADIFNPIADKLLAANVFVTNRVYSFLNGFAIFGMFLPHEGYVTTDPEVGGLNAGTTFDHPEITTANWLGGEVLYIDCRTSEPFFGAGSVNDPPTSTVDPHTNLNDYQIATIQASYSRYEKFGHHIVHIVETSAQAADGGQWATCIDASKAVVQTVCDSLVDYGVTLSVHDGIYGLVGPPPADRAEVISSIQNRVVSFFGL